MSQHTGRVAHFVLDVGDLEQGAAFWSAALDATGEAINPGSSKIYRRLRLPDSKIRILLQLTAEPRTGKERMHLDLETDDVEAEVCRLEALGAIRWDHQQDRGYDFWVMHDPWGNEFCVLQTEFPDLLAQRRQAHWGEDGRLHGRERHLRSGFPSRSRALCRLSAISHIESCW